MTVEEFAAWLRSLVGEGRLTPRAADDLLEQRERFDAERERWAAAGPELGPVVLGFHAGAIVEADSVGELMDRVRARDPDRLVYFEAFGYGPFDRA